jgi:hypothetical protein
MSITANAGGPNTSDGERIADESDIEELKAKVKKWRRRSIFLTFVAFITGQVLPSVPAFL